MKRPHDIQLSREEGEALVERLERDALSADDRGVLAQVVQWYFWLIFAFKRPR